MNNLSDQLKVILLNLNIQYVIEINKSIKKQSIEQKE